MEGPRRQPPQARSAAGRRPHPPRGTRALGPPGAGNWLLRHRVGGGTPGHYAAAAARMGAAGHVVVAAGGPDARAICWPPGVAEAGAGRPGGQKAEVVPASLTGDSGEEARRWAGFVVGAGAAIALADAPRTAQLQPAKGMLEEAGCAWEIHDLNAAEWGASAARRRSVVLAREPAGRFGALMEHLRAMHTEEGSAQDVGKPSSSRR